MHRNVTIVYIFGPIPDKDWEECQCYFNQRLYKSNRLKKNKQIKRTELTMSRFIHFKSLKYYLLSTTVYIVEFRVQLQPNRTFDKFQHKRPFSLAMSVKAWLTPF